MEDHYTYVHVCTHNLFVCIPVHCQVMALNNLTMMAVGQGDDGKAFQLLAEALSSQLSEHSNYYYYTGLLLLQSNVVMTRPLQTLVAV